MVREAQDIIRQLIRQRQADTNEYHDLLDLLLKAEYEDGSNMSEQQIIDEILILFTAGHETTANALSFTCQLLSQTANRHYQDQVEKSYETILASEVDTMSGIMQMTVAKQVLEESMRLYLQPILLIELI